MRASFALWLAALLVSVAGCACSGGGVPRRHDAGADGAARDGATDAPFVLTDTASDAFSEPETCDGIDNDGNGIVDDVDVGHDGVCDCLFTR